MKFKERHYEIHHKTMTQQETPHTEMKQEQTISRASTRENRSLGFANNKSTDQPAHPRRLISAFVNHFLEKVISKLTTSEISL